MRQRLGASDLLPRGPVRRIGRSVLVFDEIDSTNAYLRRRADELPDGTIAWAEYQSAGRGRAGRSWLAPRGSSILLSVLLHEPSASVLPRCASLLACVAACEAVESATECRPQVRWPNDLIVGSRKLGGVLVECFPLNAGRMGIVIGVGINCLQQPGHFAGPLAGVATSLEIESRAPVDRRAVAAELLARLDRWIAAGPEADALPGRVRDAWRRRCADIGTRGTLQCGAQIVSGTILDVTDDADLVVQLDAGGRRQLGSATTTRLG